MENGLWGKMMQLNSPKSQKSVEEIRNRNHKAVFHEITKNDDFKGTFIWAVFSVGRTLLDYGATLQHPHII